MSGPERRTDNSARDRISALAHAWSLYQERLETWRASVDNRIQVRTYIVLAVLVLFCAGFVAAAGTTRDLYRRSSDRSQEAVRIIEQFQSGREQNARASCDDRNTDRKNLRGLGQDLGGEELERRVAERFPEIDCDTYVRDTLSLQGREPLPRIVPSPTPGP